MNKKNYYNIEKNIYKIKRGEYTNFLDPKISTIIKHKLKKEEYKIYLPYKESDKIILYTKKEPDIKLLEIISYNKLTHREIMGSLYHLNIDSEMFGDIIIWNNHYYILIMNSIYNLLINEYKLIGNNTIKLKETPINILENYQRQFQTITIIVSSLRIDTVISRLIGSSRNAIKEKFENDEIIINYEINHKINYILKPSDVFSIRKYGKYIYIGIEKESKKGNYIIKCHKYIDS